MVCSARNQRDIVVDLHFPPARAHLLIHVSSDLGTNGTSPLSDRAAFKHANAEQEVEWHSELLELAGLITQGPCMCKTYCFCIQVNT